MLQAELLQTVRPGHFASFRAFVMWRQTSGRLMAQVLSRGLQSTPGLVSTPILHQCWAYPHNLCDLHPLMYSYLNFSLGKMPVFGSSFFH